MEKCECGSEEFEFDGSQGEKLCRECGRILESRALVNELAFDNTNVHGKFGLKSGNYTQIKACKEISHYNSGFFQPGIETTKAEQSL